MDSVGRFITIVVAVVLVLIMPLSEIAKGHAEAMQGRADRLTEEFTDTARHQGHITTDMYEDYLTELGKLGDTYNISLQVAHPVTGKESADRNSGVEIPDLTAEYASFKGGAQFQTKQLQATTHIHTDDCYSGHRHQEKTTYTHYHAHDGSCRKGNSAVMPSGICNYCNKLTHTGYMYYYFDSSFNQVFASAYWPTTCMNCNNPLSTRNNTTIYSVMYSCGYAIDLTGDGYPDEVPMGVTQAYVGKPLPQNYAGNTIINGCYSYHTHATTYAGRLNNGYWVSDSYLSMTDDARARAEGRSTYRDQWGSTVYQPYVFNYIHEWAADVINHYGGKPCSFPDTFYLSWSRKLSIKYVVEPYNYLGVNKFEFPITLILYPRKLNGSAVFDYQLNVGVYNPYNRLRPPTMVWEDYNIKSIDGKFSKPYFTIADLANFGNIEDIYDYFYSLLIDKSSNSAKILQLYRTPYTSIEKAYYEYGGTYDLYVFDYRQPIVGYVSDLNLPAYSDYKSSGKGSRGKISASGNKDLCAYTGGPVGNWNYDCGQVQDDTLDCGNVVMSLTATNPNQTVFKGDSIITTATATMMDQTVKTVNCTASGYDSNSIGTQLVTLTYYGLVNNAKTTGTKSCTTTVTVKSRKTLTGITVTPTSQEIKRYTDPTFSVTASYSDGTSNQVMSFTTSGLDNTKIGDQTVTISYTEEGVNKTAHASVTVKRLTKICDVCATVYELDDSDIDQGCPTCSGTIVGIRVSPEEVTVSKGEDLPVVVTATYKDGRTGILSGWTSDYNSNQIGLQNVKFTYETFSAIVMVTVSANKTCPICGNVYSMNPDGTDPGCPVCAEEVVSIDASPKDVTIERNGTLPITVVATYKDGHTNVIDGWGTDFLADKTGEYEVPIYYQTAVDYIHVTVLDEGMITCPYCHTQYSYTDHPNGCPICSKQIVGIEAQLRYGGNQVLYRSDLSLQVVLIYRDTHRKITYTGFEYSGFDSSILGIQTVTVTYGEFSTTLTVEVIDNPFLITCPVCGSQYYLNEDGSDPGCPYCNKDLGENAVFYFECTYTMNILDTLYNNGIYYLTEGDYFTVTITTIRDSIISKLANLFRSRKREDFKKENSSFGGEVSII